MSWINHKPLRGAFYSRIFQKFGNNFIAREVNKDNILRVSQNAAAKFERLCMPHLDAAYNLALWLCRDESAADDIVQESYLRAFKAMNRFDEQYPRAWLLAIVRNQSYNWLKKSARHVRLDDMADDALVELSDTADVAMETQQDIESVRSAIAELPEVFREVVVLGDMEGLPYAQIASVIGLPIGTVMSRLSRGRGMIKKALMDKNHGR